MGNFGAFHLSPCTELDARKQLLTGNGTASSSRRADGVTAHRGRPAHPPRLIRAMASLRLRLGLATQVLEVARENSPDSIFQGNEFQTRPIHDPTVAPVPRNDMADEGTNCPGQHLHLKALNREREAVHISYAQPPGVFDKSTRKADVDEAGCAELKLNRGFRSNEDTRPPPRNGAAHPSQRLQSWWCLFQVATGVEDFLVPVHGMHPSDAAVKKSSEEASPSARGSPTTEDRPFLVANSVPAPPRERRLRICVRASLGFPWVLAAQSALANGGEKDQDAEGWLQMFHCAERSGEVFLPVSLAYRDTVMMDRAPAFPQGTDRLSRGDHQNTLHTAGGYGTLLAGTSPDYSRIPDTTLTPALSHRGRGTQLCSPLPRAGEGQGEGAIPTCEATSRIMRARP